MADIIIKIIDPADTNNLITLDELKLMINVTTTLEDDMLQMWIDHYSDVIATMCNRVFAKEHLQETWRGDTPPYDTLNGRIFLTHYPVAIDDLESVTFNNGAPIDSSTYTLEERSGKLQFFNGGFSEPITVTYSGGYDLPDEAPQALKQATILMVQAARLMQQRALTSGIRSVSHKDKRVQYFDYLAAQAKMIGSNPIAAAAETVKSLLYHYVRFNV